VSPVIPNSMISSKEFQQKLNAGQIKAALALILSEAKTIDVTTQMTDELEANVRYSLSSGKTIAAAKFPKSEYLRTKIDLLTGEIHNEVGKDLIINSSNYLKLQQLHIDQIVASHQIVQSHLHQIQGILTAMSPSEIEPESVNENLAATLPTRLTEAFKAILTAPTEDLSQNYAAKIDIQPTSLAEQISEDLTFAALPQPSPPLAQPSGLKSVLSPVAFDDEIDLSIDENTVEWEEWVEDEEVEPIPVVQYSAPTIQELNIPDWGEDWDRQKLEPITVKPTAPRTPVAITSVDPVEQWDKFMPEYIGIYVESKSNSANNDNDPHQVDKLLADLDKISQEQATKN
jgi:hypothetical protein